MKDLTVVLFYNHPRKWLQEARQSYYLQEFSGRSELIEIHKNQSTAKNLNEACKQANGKYIKYLCDDDMLLPGCLQLLFDHAEATEADIVCAGAINYNVEEGTTENYFSVIPETVGKLAELNTIHGGTTLFKTSALKDVDYFNEELNYGEEYDLYLRLAVAGYGFTELKDVVYLYRLHNEMKSMQTIVYSGNEYINRKREIFNLIQEKYLGNNCKIVTL